MANNGERDHELKTLVSNETRYQNLRDLEHTYESLSEMIKQHDE